MDALARPYNLETFAGGVSSAVSPDLLTGNQVAWAMNADFRGSKVHTRPNIHQRMFLPPGRVQGIAYFDRDGGSLVVVIAGVPYSIQVGVRTDAFSYTQVTLATNNNPLLKQCWMAQAVDTLIIQDGQSAPIIFDGAVARRSDLSAAEVPIGTAMAYGNGRLWVAVNSNQLVAGDIRTDEQGSELFFTENQYLSGGGSLIFNSEITGLAFIPITGTSDYGALVCFQANHIDTVRADITSRDSWASYPGFVTNAMRGVGSPSGRSITPVNQDLMWRDSTGGIRSLKSSLYSQQSGDNATVSREVSRLVDYDSQQLLGYSSGVHFKNRLLMTSSPFMNTQGGVSHRDLICLDFAPVSTMQAQNPPAYNGTWQGVNWTQLVKGDFNSQTRAFGISSDEDGFNRLWEFDTGLPHDISISQD